MRDISTWRRALPVALILALLVVTEAGLIAQNLGSAPQTNVAVQGQTGAQPEGTWLNLINWIGNVIAPVGAGGAALAAIVSFAAGRGFARRGGGRRVPRGQWSLPRRGPQPPSRPGPRHPSGP